eukprot:254054_1
MQQFAQYQDDEMITLSNDENVDLLLQDKNIEIYENVLSKSLIKSKIVIAVSLVLPFLLSTRFFIIDLYVESISNATTSTISIITFCSLIWGSIITFTTVWLGDKFGHDKMLLIAFIVTVIGVFLESIANNLLIFFIGFFISRVQFLGIAFAYLAFILPHKYAIKHMAIFYSLASIIYLVGPIITGIVVNYINYRSVFILNVII